MKISEILTQIQIKACCESIYTDTALSVPKNSKIYITGLNFDNATEPECQSKTKVTFEFEIIDYTKS
ncbi:MAG: hypothetical protein KAJ10_15975 [Thermodesulfovibrionia bacterium]|nr:hypothetical protein [Thermodesulfovibrionia bacterium]